MMSKRSAIILILAVFLGALGALIYFYFSFNTGSPKAAITPITTGLARSADSFNSPPPRS